jgi:hypothetical protein
MSYLGLSFQLLELGETLTFYRSVYFAGHVLVLALYLVGRLAWPSGPLTVAEVDASKRS